MSTFLNSFYPLCYTKKGLEAVARGLPPFVDGSIRREPDFENEYPAITGLCRTDKLISRLHEGDKVIYITNKGTYNGNRHWCMIAVLQVEQIVNSHLEAAKFYKDNDLLCPQNLMIPETKRKPIGDTHQDNKKFQQTGNVESWEREYIYRASKYPKVALCSIFKNYLYLVNPPVINDDTMISVFGKRRGTQMPPKLKDDEELRFFDWLSHSKFNP